MNLLQKYWEWRNKIPEVNLKTEHGHSVVQFGDKWALKKPGNVYLDFKSPSHKWSQESNYFNDCLVTKGFLELHYGKIIFPNTDKEETNK